MVVSGLPNAIDTNFGLEQICFNMTHTWDDDMEVKLKSPDGRIVFLFSHVGGDGDNFAATCLRADAGTAIGSASAPFTGYYKPMGDLGLFNNGQNPNGTWTFIVHDTYPFADQGYLQGWGLAFGNNPAKPFPFFSSNLPIIKLNAHGNVIPNEPKIEADFEIIDHGTGARNYVSDTVYAFKGKIMTEQQGYSGPYYPKKNYDLYTIYSDSTKLDTSLLGMPKEHDWILKAEYLDLSIMKNPMIYELSRMMGVYAPRTKYCEVTVNGEYMGVYSLTEKIKRDKNRVDIAKLSKTDTAGANLTGGYIFEMNINGDPPQWTSQYLPINYATSQKFVEFKDVYPKVDSILPVQQNYIHAYMDSFENSLMRDSIDPNTWRALASENSFIDFQIVNEFSVNYDTYGRSTYLYKDKNKKLHIGPPWDYDRSYFPGTETGWVWEITHQGWPFPFWWSKLNSDSIYQKKLWCRWNTLRETTLSTDSFMLFIDSTSALLQESAARNFLKWSELGVTDYNHEVSTLKDFINVRLPWMDANILPYEEYIPTLNLNDTTICKTELIDINIGNQYQYMWSNGATGSIISVAQTNTFAVSVEDDYGCSASDDITVYVSEPDASFTTVQNSAYNFSFSPLDNSATNYQWEFGDDSISNFKLPTHTYDTIGTYIISLTITDSIGCSIVSFDTISVVPASSVVENTVLNAVKIYPNPFGDFFEIEISDMKRETNFKLKDVTGSVMANRKLIDYRTKISTSNLSAGIYFAEIIFEDGSTQLYKLTKQ